MLLEPMRTKKTSLDSRVDLVHMIFSRFECEPCTSPVPTI